MEQWASALIQLGVAGIGLYLFVQGKLVASSVVAQIVALVDERVAEWRERYEEMRDDRDAWRELALGNEHSVDLARPIIAEAVGAASPPAYTGPDRPPCARPRTT